MPAAAAPPGRWPTEVDSTVEDGGLHQRGNCRQARLRRALHQAQIENDSENLGKGKRTMSEPRPQKSDSWSPATAQRIEQACNCFEAAYRANPPVKAEDFLGESPEPDRSALLRELLLLELEYRCRAGENPAPGEYLARFPGQSQLVRACFNETVPPSTQHELRRLNDHNRTG